MKVSPQKYSILIIDEEFDDPQCIFKTLQRESFNVEKAAAGDDLLVQAQEMLPDIIILSLIADAERAVEILRQLKDCEQTRLIPVIFLVSPEEQEDFKDILDYDEVDLMPRPLNSQAIIARIHHQLLLLESYRTIEQQNKKLKEEIQAKEIFYSVIAHDLRSPMATIKMLLDALNKEKGEIKDKHILRLIRMLTETTDEAFALLDNLLMWSNSQNGMLQPDIREMNIQEAVNEVVALEGNVTATKHVRLINRIKTPHTCYADKNMIKTVLRNLISNAIKYSYSEGSITIDVEAGNKELIVSVKDNGQGISPENQQKLRDGINGFTTYGTANEKGSGLGLKLVRNFIQLNHGRLWFESEERQGTTFFFSIPTRPIS